METATITKVSETETRKPERAHVLDGYVYEADLAADFGLTTRTLRAWRRRGLGPPFVVVGRDHFYSVEGVRAWVRENEINPVRAGRRTR